MVPAAAKNFFMTIAIAQNLLNIDSTEFKLRSIYSNQGLLDVSRILVLFLIIELCILAANTFEKGFPACCCCSLSETKAWQCGFAFKNSGHCNFTSFVAFAFQVHRSPAYSRVLYFVFKKSLWGGAPHLIKMLMSCDDTGWKLDLTRSEESQTLCVLCQTVTTDNTPGRAVCILEILSWGFSKIPTMCWRALAVVLGLHTRGSSWMCRRVEGWKSALWCASSSCLTGAL